MTYEVKPAHNAPINVHICQVRYAAFLYDRFLDCYPHEQALSFACRYADIRSIALQVYLPKHNRNKKDLRNIRIVRMKKRGYPVTAIARFLNLNRSTVSRVLDQFSFRSR